MWRMGWIEENLYDSGFKGFGVMKSINKVCNDHRLFRRTVTFPQEIGWFGGVVAAKIAPQGINPAGLVFCFSRSG